MSALRYKIRGFNLLESLFAVVIMVIVCLGTIGAIIYTRQSMELEKQRIAALNYARQVMEAAETSSSVDAGSKTLVPFNQPGVAITATLTVNYYPIAQDSVGTVAWDSPTSTPSAGVPCLCRVNVT